MSEIVDGGSLPVTRDGRFPIPREFREEATMRTWARTKVFHKHTSTVYEDAEHPELHPAYREFYIEFAPHGEDRRVRYRLDLPGDMIEEETPDDNQAKIA